MALKHAAEYRDPEISRKLVQRIRRLSRRKVRLMEVCGTHTMSIFRAGIRALLPERIHLLSGPGCPVCVTAQSEIDAFITLAGMEGVTVATFGDLIRVPGSRSSLQEARAAGADVRTVYSTFDALDIARRHPEGRVVFLGVGFETTAPTVAAALVAAAQAGLTNFKVFCAHKLVPPALAALMETPGVQVDGFMLPGHVSVVIGADAYRPVLEKYGIPGVVAGFEPADILQAVALLVQQIEGGRAQLENAYPRAVTGQGNAKARQMMAEVFETVDARWRGIGVIPGSGLRIRDRYAAFDARKTFDIALPDSETPTGCACGDILTGRKTPPDCPLYKTKCTPDDPVGPCMVSSEGTCAAYFRYHAGE